MNMRGYSFWPHIALRSLDVRMTACIDLFAKEENKPFFVNVGLNLCS